ncbi:gastrula zinc finger protein XlCGF26.1-like isoform X2 [Rhinatrema bivittatum]|uniref:gastrula zinc finger protein XlCGF26.1-like isoform X2 n=1 Tax=Rhinatrema bivittatum TaxID=194408 RepID=UPI001126D064|nr:gastrula zinc finger protein XlCGF26.1-like isoform X2 [Rhinatrema bivittatum]
MEMKDSAAADPESLSIKDDEPCSYRDQSVSETRENRSPSTSLPVTTSVFAFDIKQEHADSERREAPIMNSIAADPVVLSGINEEDESYSCSDYSDPEEMKNNPNLGTAALTLCTKKEEEPNAIGQPDPERREIPIMSKGPKNKIKYYKRDPKTIATNNLPSDKERENFCMAFPKSDGSRACNNESLINKAMKCPAAERQDKWTLISKRGTNRCHTNSIKQKLHMYTNLLKNFTEENSLVSQPPRFTGRKSFTCTECDKSFCVLSHLKRHQMIHTGERPFNCSECNKSFNQKSSLRNHEMIHTGKKTLICTECHKSFFTLSHLKRHQMIHTGARPFNCSACNKSFNQKSSLRKHEMIHTEKKTFTCSKCEKCFCSKVSLRIHEMIHCEGLQYKCSNCDKSFNQKSSLRRHDMIHRGGKPFKCLECDKGFSRLSHLREHQMLHTGEKPYNCSVCHKTFRQKCVLIEHEKIHAGKNPFKCSGCDKSFNRKCTLKRHAMIHTGEKPFKCSECDKSFNQNSTLKKHEMIHSGENARSERRS